MFLYHLQKLITEVAEVASSKLREEDGNQVAPWRKVVDDRIEKKTRRFAQVRSFVEALSVLQSF